MEGRCAPGPRTQLLHLQTSESYLITSSQNVIFQTSKNSNLEKQGLALGSLEELAQDGRGERRLATLFLRLDRGRKVISSQTGLLDTSTDELQEIEIGRAHV